MITLFVEHKILFFDFTFIEIGKKSTAQPAFKCNPLRSVALAFSAPVLASEVKQYVRFDPDLAGCRKDYDTWANKHDSSSLGAPHRQDVFIVADRATEVIL